MTFHSGNPARAEDVVGSVARVIKLNLTPAFILTQLGWTPENVEQMVTAEGNTVTVRYEGDFSPAFVLIVLASRPASVVDMVTVTENEVDGDMGNAWLNANSAGSGPFSLQTFRPAELERLEANPEYFKGAPLVEGVILRHSPARGRIRDAAAPAGAGRRGYGEAPDPRPDRDPGPTGDQGGGLPPGRRPPPVLHQKAESLTKSAVWEAARYLVDYEGMTNSFLAGQMETH
ncbi:ABC transporter substrate-binding protein [Rubellimicrobium rubrum]|uniref:ABC transporter substrate-binding protein n=1 Tax=Rubellimicrobium rubrum TaxID=2585369 RepID=UPI00159B8961|nr:ABC transporter substrate-binding protein [Rubellimicrobium rubrum]